MHTAHGAIYPSIGFNVYHSSVSYIKVIEQDKNKLKRKQVEAKLSDRRKKASSALLKHKKYH